MMNRQQIFLLCNVGYWDTGEVDQQISDLADALSSGDCYAISSKDEMTAICMSTSGAALLRQAPMLSDTIA